MEGLNKQEIEMIKNALLWGATQLISDSVDADVIEVVGEDKARKMKEEADLMIELANKIKRL